MIPIDYLDCRSVGEVSIRPRRLSWRDFVVMLSRFDVVERKDETRLYVPCRPKSEVVAKGRDARGRLRYRHEGNMEAVTMAVFDLDEDADGSLAAFRERYEGVEAVVHSTFSHGMDGKGPRYRCVLPLAEPVPAEAWKSVYRGLADGLGIDSTRCNPVSMFYFPCVRAGAGRHWEHLRGRWLSRSDVERAAERAGDAGRAPPAAAPPRDWAPVQVRELGSEASFAVARGGRAWPEPDLALCAVDYTERSLAERHADSLGRLRASGGGHRDAFTLSVVSRELRVRGAQTHLRLLAWWMWRAMMAMPGAKPLWAGDSAASFPGKVARAAADLGIASLSGVDVVGAGRRAMAWVAEHCAAPWPVREDGSLVEGEPGWLGADWSMSALSERHASALDALRNGGEWAAAAGAVWSEESGREGFVPEPVLMFLGRLAGPGERLNRMLSSPGGLAKLAGWEPSREPEMAAAVALAKAGLADGGLGRRILPVVGDPLLRAMRADEADRNLEREPCP